MTITQRMRELEALDDRTAGKGTLRLRQVTRSVGQVLQQQVAFAPQGNIVEIGTGGGYSTLWLALGTNRPITTFEMNPDKVVLAEQTFAQTGLTDRVTLVAADVNTRWSMLHTIAFCFLDSKKSTYVAFYEQIVPKLVGGGLLLVDNCTTHDDGKRLVEHAKNDVRVTTKLEQDVLICVKL